MEVKSYPMYDRPGQTLAVTFDDTKAMMNDYLLNGVLHKIADAIAERWVAEHYQEVVAAIKPEAVATLVCAEAGAAINKTLKEKIPDKVLEVVKKEVWQRGVLGGMTRIR